MARILPLLGVRKNPKAVPFIGFGVLVTMAAVAVPTIEVRPVDRVRPGEPFEVSLEVRWEGDPERYVISPVAFEPVEGIQIHPMRTESKLVNGQPVISQVLSVVVGEAGTYEMPALTVLAHTQEELGASGITSPTDPKTPQPSPLTVPPFPVEARPHRPLAWIAGALTLLLLLCLGLGWRFASPQRNRQAQSPSPAKASPPHAFLEAAQRARAEDDLYGFYRHLAAALACAAAVEPPLRDRIKQRTADVGYRGARPNQELLDGDYRDVARAVNHTKEEAAA